MSPSRYLIGAAVIAVAIFALWFVAGIDAPSEPMIRSRLRVGGWGRRTAGWGRATAD